MTVNEIFFSIQGESSYSGLPCVFIRLTGCPLRCAYCDTEYAFYEGRSLTLPEILEEVTRFDCRLVEITGGEPLAQKECTDLMQALIASGYTVLLETSGALSLKEVPQNVIKIMDIKCPSSREADKNLYENIAFLKLHDEIKFVIGTREDYDFAKETVKKYALEKKHAILFSPVYGTMELKTLAGWILRDGICVRLQTQLHKLVWGENVRGV